MGSVAFALGEKEGVCDAPKELMKERKGNAGCGIKVYRMYGRHGAVDCRAFADGKNDRTSCLDQ